MVETVNHDDWKTWSYTPSRNLVRRPYDTTSDARLNLSVLAKRYGFAKAIAAHTRDHTHHLPGYWQAVRMLFTGTADHGKWCGYVEKVTIPQYMDAAGRHIRQHTKDLWVKAGQSVADADDRTDPHSDWYVF